MYSIFTVASIRDTNWVGSGLIGSVHIQVDPYMPDSDPTRLLLNGSKWKTQTQPELNGSTRLDPHDPFIKWLGGLG